MVGIILGLGFQWVPAFQEPWQYIAFVFAYFDIVDYWIDYAPSLKKFPPKREADIFLDLGIMFLLFLYIYATQLAIIYFLASFIIFRLLDFVWLINALHEYRPTGKDRIFVTTWLEFNLFETFMTAIFIGAGFVLGLTPLVQIIIYIICRIIVRIAASLRYRQFYFA